MKDIFCASQSSTAISLSIMDQTSSSLSSSSSNTIQLGGRAIDRHNPIITDSRRTPSRDFNASSSSSKPPIIDPKPCLDLQKAKEKYSSKPSEHNKRIAAKGHYDQKKKSVVGKLTEHITNNYSCKPIDSILKKSWVRPPVDLITPAGSSRYLLGDSASYLASVSDHVDQILVDDKKAQVTANHDETNHASKPSSSSAPKSGSSDQVVVLRVSLHCKGCEGKVRKHLSRMQGVKSFNIDFVAKKVTVVGDVTPLRVLASLSKVKNAQIWPAGGSGGMAEAKKKKLI